MSSANLDEEQKVTAASSLRGLPRHELHVAPGIAQDFEQFRWALSPIYDVDAATPETRSTYGAHTEGYFYNEMPISSVAISASRYTRDRRVVAKTGLDSILLTVYDEGRFQFEAEGEARVAQSGDIVALDLTRRSAILATDARCLCVNVPRYLLTPLSDNIDDWHGVLLPKGAAVNTLLVSHLRLLLDEAPKLDVATGIGVTKATAGLVAACFGGAKLETGQTRASISSALLRLIRQEIDDHLADPSLNVDYLAKRFKMSRTKLYTMFEPLGGIMAYIQQRRLMGVHRDLLNPALFHARIMTLAETWGFRDKAVFSRAYRAMYEMAPSEARAQARVDYQGAGPLNISIGDSFLRVNRWLYGLECAA